MNKRRGFIRLAIVVAIAWTGFWSAAWYYNYHRMMAAIETSRGITRVNAGYRESGGKGDLIPTSETLAALQEMSDADSDATWAASIGIGFPIIFLIIAGVAYWIYLGFKPKLVE